MSEKKKVLVISKDERLNNFLGGLKGSYELMFLEELEIEKIFMILEKESPDLVILDIMMPTMEGIGKIIEINHFYSFPMIALSMWGADKDMVKMTDFKQEDHLGGSVTIYTLKGKIKEVFNRRK